MDGCLLETISSQLLLVSGNDSRSPEGSGNRNYLFWLTCKVIAGYETVSAIGGGFYKLAIDDLVREANLQDPVGKSFAE